MRPYLSGADLYSAILIMRSGWKGTLLTTEGATDSRLLNSFIEPSQCQMVPGFGKESVIEAINIVDRRGPSGVVGIVDADFDHIDGTGARSSNILVTDYHDLLVMIFESRALDKFVANWCNPDKVHRFVESGGFQDLRHGLLCRALPLALLRRHSYQNNLNLRFQEAQVERFINRDDLTINLTEMVGRVLQRSHLSLTIQDEIVGHLQRSLLADHDLLQVCNGHDLLYLMAIGLRSALGNLTGAESLSPAQLEGVMRTAYELTDFEKTSLYAQIRRWEARNMPFRILPN